MRYVFFECTKSHSSSITSDHIQCEYRYTSCMYRSWRPTRLSLFKLSILSILLLWPRPSNSMDCSTALACMGGAAAACLLVSRVANKVRYNSLAKNEGRSYKGNGVFYSKEIFMDTLSESDRQYVNSSNTEPIEKVRRIVELLDGDDSNKHLAGISNHLVVLFGFVKRFNAEDIIKGRSCDRGNCGVKARVLVAVLNDIGVEAQMDMMVFQGRPTGLHAVAYLPELDLFADPTWGIVGSKSHVESKIRNYFRR